LLSVFAKLAAAGDKTSIRAQSDGKLVVAGTTDSGAGFDFVLARYDGNGALDPTFGSGGVVVTSFSSSSART